MTQRVPATITVTDDERRAQYATWRDYAAGIQPLPRPRPGETNNVYNYARTLIRKAASYVFPGPVAFQVIDDTGKPEENNQTEYLLTSIYTDLDLHDFDMQQEIERSTIGDCAEKITWDKQRNKPRVVSVDPATLTAKWSPDNPQVAHEITQVYETPGWALAPYKITPSDPNQMFRVVETWSDQTWRMEIPSLGYAHAEANPYGWIPYLVLPNTPAARSFWGQSDLVDIRQPQDDLNRELSVLGYIMQVSGAPITVIENISSSENLTFRPGAKWELPEDSKAYLLNLLEGGGIGLHMDYIEQLRRVINDLAETPRTAFGDSGNSLSGVALEIEIQPMVQRTKRKRAGWNRHYSARNRRLLDLMQRYGGTAIPMKDRNTTTIWPPILPTDDDSLVMQQTQLVGSGIRSILTANKALGTPDPEAEVARVKAERAERDAARQANDQQRPQKDNDDAASSDL